MPIICTTIDRRDETGEIVTIDVAIHFDVIEHADEYEFEFRKAELEGTPNFGGDLQWHEYAYLEAWFNAHPEIAYEAAI